jgi:hypothetical protein
VSHRRQGFSSTFTTCKVPYWAGKVHAGGVGGLSVPTPLILQFWHCVTLKLQDSKLGVQKDIKTYTHGKGPAGQVQKTGGGGGGGGSLVWFVFDGTEDT